MPCSMTSTVDSQDQDCDLTGILLEAAGALGITLAKRELSLFSLYRQELITWNRIVSLVAVKSPLDIPIKHFIDSLTPLSLLPREGRRLVDLGTGAGFPGLPLKIIRPDLELHLLEVSRKKVSFLKELIRKSGLSGVTVVHERVEQVITTGRFLEYFDCVISRAAFKMPELLDMGFHFLRPGGLLAAMRGPRDEGANQNVGHLIENKGFHLEDIVDFRLPVTGTPRKIILYKKI